MLHLKDHTDTVADIAYLPGDRLVAVDRAGWIILWDLLAGRPLKKQASHPRVKFTAVAVIVGGKGLYTGSSEGHVTDFNPQLARAASSRHYGPVSQLVSSKQMQLAYGIERQFDGSEGGTVFATPHLTQHDMSAPYESIEVGGTGCHSLDISPRESLIAIARSMGAILWEPSPGGIEEFRLEDRSHPFLPVGKTVKSVAFHPSGDQLALAAGWTVQIWDVAEREKLAEFAGHQSDVTRVAFTRDGSRLLSISRDKSVIVWDYPSGQIDARFDWEIGTLSSVVASPDSSTAAVCGKQGIVVWELG